MKIRMLRSKGLRPGMHEEPRLEGETYDVSAEEAKELIEVMKIAEEHHEDPKKAGAAGRTATQAHEEAHPHKAPHPTTHEPAAATHATHTKKEDTKK